MEKYLKLVDQKIKDLETIINCQIEDDYQEYIHYSDDWPEKKKLLNDLELEINRIESEIQHWKDIKLMLEAWVITYNNTFGNENRYEINISKFDSCYKTFDKAFKLTDKIISGGKN